MKGSREVVDAFWSWNTGLSGICWLKWPRLPKQRIFLKEMFFFIFLLPSYTKHSMTTLFFKTIDFDQPLQSFCRFLKRFWLWFSAQNSVSNFFGTPFRLSSSFCIRKWTPRVDRRGLACCRRRKEIFPLLLIIVLFSTFYCCSTEKNKLRRQERYDSSKKYGYPILWLGVQWLVF